MLKLEIKLDEEKVRAEQKYSPAAIKPAGMASTGPSRLTPPRVGCC